MTSFVVPASLNTMQEIIVWAEAQFKMHSIYFGHGTDNALDEAAYLISHCANKPVDFSADDLSYRLSNIQRQQVTQVLEQRIIKRLPAAYITNKAYFFGLEFYVDENVLIPRSPIAELISEYFSPWFNYQSYIESNKPLNILDMCTGSGCIAIACATAFENARVDAVDVSMAAIDISNKNIVNYALTQRVTAIQSDMFQSLASKKYDIIVSNPPYVTQTEIDELPDEYHREPELGLYAAENGLQFAIEILKNANHFLSDTGIIIIEVGNSAEALQHYYPNIEFTWLEFEMGGDGVFMLDAAQVKQYHSQF